CERKRAPMQCPYDFEQTGFDQQLLHSLFSLAFFNSSLIFESFICCNSKFSLGLPIENLDSPINIKQGYIIPLVSDAMSVSVAPQPFPTVFFCLDVYIRFATIFVFVFLISLLNSFSTHF